MSFESSRSMGRAATLLIIIGPIISMTVSFTAVFFRLLSVNLYFSIIFSIFSFAAYILFLAAMNGLAKYYEDPAIFRNSLYAFITTIVGAIVFIIVMFAFLLPTFDQLITTPITPGAPASSLSVFYSLLRVIAFVWLGAFVIALVQGIFYRRAFYALAEKSGEGKFRQAGFWMLIGGALTIVLIGTLIFYVGWIFAAMGFFSMKAKAAQAYPPPPQEIPTQAMTQKKYCPRCGAENGIDAVFCSYCGNKL